MGRPRGTHPFPSKKRNQKIKTKKGSFSLSCLRNKRKTWDGAENACLRYKRKKRAEKQGKRGEYVYEIKGKKQFSVLHFSLHILFM